MRSNRPSWSSPPATACRRVPVLLHPTCHPLPLAQAAVEAAVQALLQADPSQLGAPPQDLLLAALAVAPAAAAPPLATGLLELFARQAAGRSSHSSAASASPAAWRSHLVSKALLANPAAAQPLVLGVTRLLSRAAGQAEGGALDRMLAAVQPFLSLVLLDPALQQQHPALAPQLHGALARLACCAPSAAAEAALVRLLVSHLPALRLQGADSQAAASAAVGDVLDVLESCAEEPGEAMLPLLYSPLHGSVCCWRTLPPVAAFWPSSGATSDDGDDVTPLEHWGLHCTHLSQTLPPSKLWPPPWCACVTMRQQRGQQPCCSSSWRRSPTCLCTGLTW